MKPSPRSQQQQQQQQQSVYNFRECRSFESKRKRKTMSVMSLTTVFMLVGVCHGFSTMSPIVLRSAPSQPLISTNNANNIQARRRQQQQQQQQQFYVAASPTFAHDYNKHNNNKKKKNHNNNNNSNNWRNNHNKNHNNKVNITVNTSENNLLLQQQQLDQHYQSMWDHSTLTTSSHTDSHIVNNFQATEPAAVVANLNYNDKIKIVMSTIFAVLTSYWVLTMSGSGAWRYYLAGGICAATSHAIATPADVIKTKKQVDPTLQDKSFVSATRQMIKQYGVKSLWVGVGPTIWGYLMEGAVKFGVYEALKPITLQTLAHLATLPSGLGPFVRHYSRALAFILSGTVAGIAASFVVCPMEAIRIRLVANPQLAQSSGGWVHAGTHILKNEGLSGLCKGIKPMILKQVPYTVTKNVSFDLLTTQAYSLLRANGYAVTAISTTYVISLAAAAMASILSCISSQPGDLILSLINTGSDERRTTRQIFQDIINSKQHGNNNNKPRLLRGIQNFFVGFQPRVVHVGMIVTTQLLIYDFVKRLCGIAATGSM